MKITRRGLTLGGAGLATASGLGLSAPALAQSEPIRIGWLAALTGPSSAPAIGFDRGIRHATDAINAAGGIGGRQIELVVRDTQGDPTKAVNAAQEMISRARVHAIWGPTNSGESLATTPIIGRAKMPNLHPCFVDTLIDPARYPNAFRMAPSNSQIDDAVSDYGVNILKLKKFAVVGDTTGYGTTTVNSSSAAFAKRNAEVVYRGQIDATQPDLTPDMLRMRNAGAEAITIWTVSPGLISRIMNVRATMGWDVPLIGHPAMGSGEVGQLIAKPQNWEKTYILGFKNCSYGPDGKLPGHVQTFVDSIQGKINLDDSTLWWIVCGVDAINVIASAVRESGGTDPLKMIDFWNKQNPYPGLYASYTWTPQQHNGLPQSDLVMSEANSQRQGAYKLAPGYV
ncbi:amino acid/amide ABC transporter substrate-binding protein (HAAT family) [Humitalea rosea]|uniref:Amino acid/amide ABC transporter substrate-binding protein (HAAT family) n=1 Tax=Humitalea rosea TaxID=990373 RepID=A0A2W7IF89_9PROT|nr:ABC transporter substrate-binding protein [Humitalea rosea]PZW44748.1 amino acid/amide ABC transporter substrate-binding protein (HAAT family) [Humitalea rosea]